MTSRSRVRTNAKYKLNSKNLEKFEELLSKIPEAQKPVVIRGGSATSVVYRDPAPSTVAPESPEKPASIDSPVKLQEHIPDIRPSATMGSAVTAEYEQFCKSFHSEPTEVLKGSRMQLHGNPVRQLLQSASWQGHHDTVANHRKHSSASTSQAVSPSSVPTAAAAATTHVQAAGGSGNAPKASRRWSEAPLDAPVFMAKKFADKLSKEPEDI